MLKTRAAIVFVAAVALLPAAAEGGIIVANTSGSGGALAGGQDTNLNAAGFLSPNVATTIASVQVSIGKATSPTNPSVDLDLWSNNAGVPGAFLASFGTQIDTSFNPAPFVFTPGAPVDIAASTTYWLVMTCTNCSAGTNNGWDGSNPGVLAGMPGAALITGEFFSNNGGSTWGSVANRTFTFQVNGDPTGAAVPEPATTALIGVGLVALIVARRRAHKRRLEERRRLIERLSA